MKDPGYIHVFNKIAGQYDKRFGKSCLKSHELIFEQMQSHHIAPENILDVGCGTGELLRKAQILWPKVVTFGIDPAEKMIDQARAKLPDAGLSVDRVETLPFSDNSIDLCVSTTSFSHWGDQLKSLAEIHRVLKPKGNCIIVDHFTPNILIKFTLFIINRLANLRSLPEVKVLAKQTGFTITDANKVESYFLVHLTK
jgi:ubiquinone/menaquinone biosynthesis C-methylase UbiE